VEIQKTLYVTDREAWRAWLEEHGQTEDEIWLVYYKAHTSLSSIPYSDSVEEALCFGWIDSIIKTVDDKKYVRKFTPRRPGSRWSTLNMRRAQKMIAEGRMTGVGFKKIDFDPADLQRQEPVPGKQPVIPGWMLQTIQANTRAWENFNRLAPSHKRRYFGWVLEAKREETRQRRLQEVIQVLAEGRKLGLK